MSIFFRKQRLGAFVRIKIFFPQNLSKELKSLKIVSYNEILIKLIFLSLFYQKPHSPHEIRNHPIAMLKQKLFNNKKFTQRISIQVFQQRYFSLIEYQISTKQFLPMSLERESKQHSTLIKFNDSKKKTFRSLLLLSRKRKFK